MTRAQRFYNVSESFYESESDKPRGAALWNGVCISQAHTVAWTAPKVIGAVIVVLALPLFVLARLQLGAAFSLQAEAHFLVTTGLYSRFLNPIYLFGGLTLIGCSLFRSVWGPAVVIAVMLPLQAYRVRKEERVLLEAFGDEYKRYKRQTWF